jgi:hypothetical protein
VKEKNYASFLKLVKRINIYKDSFVLFSSNPNQWLEKYEAFYFVGSYDVFLQR